MAASGHKSSKLCFTTKLWSLRALARNLPIMQFEAQNLELFRENEMSSRIRNKSLDRAELSDDSINIQAMQMQ